MKISIFCKFLEKIQNLPNWNMFIVHILNPKVVIIIHHANNVIQIIYCLSMAIIAINLHLLCLPTHVIVFCYICRRRFSERISLLFEKSSIIRTLIIPQDLVDCTAEVLARYNVGVWPQPPWQQFAIKRALIWTMLQFPKQLFKERDTRR